MGLVLLASSRIHSSFHLNMFIDLVYVGKEHFVWFPICMMSAMVMGGDEAVLCMMAFCEV